MVIATNLGFPRIGANRDLKKSVENYWSGKLEKSALLTGAKNLRLEHWQLQRKSGVADKHIPSNDFTFYDHVLDHIVMFGAIPKRYRNISDPMDRFFAMGRGMQDKTKQVDVPAMEMKKWFDTNYHYIVPEFELNQTFSLNSEKIISEYNEAKAAGIHTKPVVIGPISFLLLGKPGKEQSQFNTIELLENLLPEYEKLASLLEENGVEYVQFDEPFLTLDLEPAIYNSYKRAYQRISKSSPKIILATYFAPLRNGLATALDLPIHALHIDLVRGADQLETVLQKFPANMILSLGLIDGRNIWKSDLTSQLAKLERAVKVLGNERVYVAASCSLLHVPHSLDAETKMDRRIVDWLAFAKEKLEEIAVLCQAVNHGKETVKQKLEDNAKSISDRRSSKLVHNSKVQEELTQITPSMLKRQAAFSTRMVEQQEKLKLPSFPTTTVGSFPQTREVRVARQKSKKGDWNPEEYDRFIKDEIKKCVEFQERVGLDVLVHGEFERNDMVEYFGEQMEGYVFSQNGWVQSYGSRCVKPPIIYGDVSRDNAMTVETSVYAQSLTKLPMKGMLTGPVTMLQWSFVRDDQPRKITAFQLALALRKEVQDLEAAGIPVIQIDEPAIREGLPLNKCDWDDYLKWSVDAFLLSSTGVKNSTQIHTHMCYSDFNDIFTAIKRLDTDCITIEASKSDLKLLSAFEKFGFNNGIGPGIFDIHSPRVPSEKEMQERLQQMLQYLSPKLVWVNPDCGLKTRGWPEVEATLTNLVAVAKNFRSKA